MPPDLLTDRVDGLARAIATGSPDALAALASMWRDTMMGQRPGDDV